MGGKSVNWYKFTLSDSSKFDDCYSFSECHNWRPFCEKISCFWDESLVSVRKVGIKKALE